MKTSSVVLFLVLLAQCITAFPKDLDVRMLRGAWLVDIEATEASLLKNPPLQSDKGSQWFGMTFSYSLAAIVEFDNAMRVGVVSRPERREIPLRSEGLTEIVYSIGSENDNYQSGTYVISAVDSEHIRITNKADRMSSYLIWKRATWEPSKAEEYVRQTMEKLKEVGPRLQEILDKGQPKAEAWSDEVLLHDGRTVEVQRTVAFYKNWPSNYSLQVKHPETGRVIAWSGERYVQPVMVNFVEGAAYLAAFSEREFYLNPKLYGCPELPYVLYKFDESSSGWKLVAAAALPGVVRQTNLSARYDGAYMKNGEFQSKSSIASRNQAYFSSTGGLFDPVLPRNLDEWHYARKARFVNERFPGDCRPSLPKPVDSINPRDPNAESQRVDLEVFQTADFNPEWVLSTESSSGPTEWSKQVYDSARRKACGRYLKAANPDFPQFDGWMSFIRDGTGKTITASQHSMICDDNVIWKVDYALDGNQVQVLKLSTAGQVIYRARFNRPEVLDGYVGAIAEPTLRANDGYVQFEWWYSRSTQTERRVKRVLKAGFREPG